MKYFGGWSSYEEMAKEFSNSYPRVIPKEIPPASEILFASYNAEGYEGDALVLFEHEGDLYEVHGAHCSCYGLEGQWQPELTSWKALDMRLTGADGQRWSALNYHDETARKRFFGLVKANVK